MCMPFSVPSDYGGQKIASDLRPSLPYAENKNLLDFLSAYIHVIH